MSVSTFELLKRAERIETIAAAIYAACAKQFEAEERTRALFVRLEREELQHAARIRLLSARHRADKRLLTTVAGAGDLDECLETAERALVEVQSGGWAGDLSAVKSRLLALETRLAHVHAHALSADGHPAVREFFLELALQDEAHAQLLKDA